MFRFQNKTHFLLTFGVVWAENPPTSRGGVRIYFYPAPFHFARRGNHSLWNVGL